ncbi:MAG: CpaE family protein [Massilia sp.]
MKIAVISPSMNHLHEMGKLLLSLSHLPVLIEGGKSKMREAAEHEAPDMILVEGICCDPAELAQVEYVTTHHPHIAVVLLCATTSPDFLINSMRAGVREVLPSPATPAALEATIKRVASKLQGSAARPSGKVLSFISCKGGNGATFLATNLALELAQSKSVLLIDLNLQFGDALTFVHEARPASTLADVAREIGRLDASFLAASTVKVAPNFSLLAAPDDPSEAVEITPEHIEAVLALAVTQHDFVLLDLGRPINTHTVKALDRSHTVFNVLQANLPSLRNTKKMLAIFKSLGYPPEKIALVVNRFEKGGDIGLADIQRALGRHTVHTVANSYKRVAASINHGEPLMSSSPSNPVARSLAEFAETLNPKPEDTRGLLDRILRRASA